MAMRNLFPAYQELVFLLFLSVFARYANQQHDISKDKKSGMGLEYGTADILNETDDTPMSQSNEDSFRNMKGRMLRGDSIQT